MANSVINYIILSIFAVAPSIIWLLYFIKKDLHPEPRHEILRIFFYGALATFPAIIIELGINKAGTTLHTYLPSFIAVIPIYAAIALTEETLKYLVVKDKSLKNPECNEPVDIMIYMMSSAMGFAAVENILVLSSYTLQDVFVISVVRFVGATLLHALASGLVGYYVAISFFKLSSKKMIVFWGLIIASALHAVFNFSIMAIEEDSRYIILGAILILLLAEVVAICLRKLNKINKLDSFGNKRV
ncbi:MAG: Protease PrsW [Parcubacteria group bacterium GW2011_GWC1_38_6]|nr:MAG: Protease PrsW [Parcubacteria group bacterium GW2011_GWC1_38_6]